jgi:hypothetical protein
MRSNNGPGPGVIDKSVPKRFAFTQKGTKLVISKERKGKK